MALGSSICPLRSEADSCTATYDVHGFSNDLLDHLVGASKQWQGNRDAERLGGLEVDDQLDFYHLLDRQIGRPGTLEYTADEHADLMIRIGKVGAVAHKTASFDKLAPIGDDWDRIARLQHRELNAPAIEKWIGA